MPQLEVFNMRFGMTLYEAGDGITHVYFPNSGLVSLLASTDEGQFVEVAMTGSDGMLGIPIALGSDWMPYRAVIQVPGTALRLTAGALGEELKRDGNLRDHLLRYASGLLGEIAQSAVCNRFHGVQPRLCRWLLIASDRTGLNRFSLTQEFLSQMLGSRRQGVNQTISTLQERGLISYSRGSISIVDHERVESAACDCYNMIKREYRSFQTVGR
jgi:CRP-like cAMP-binding protein